MWVGTSTVDHSGWHVYSNMEHVMHFLAERDRPHGKGAYPRTDDILRRSVNLSIGVVDAGLASGAGISIEAGEEQIQACAERFRDACS